MFFIVRVNVDHISADRSKPLAHNQLRIFVRIIQRSDNVAQSGSLAVQLADRRIGDRESLGQCRL